MLARSGMFQIFRPRLHLSSLCRSQLQSESHPGIWGIANDCIVLSHCKNSHEILRPHRKRYGILNHSSGREPQKEFPKRPSLGLFNGMCWNCARVHRTGNPHCQVDTCACRSQMILSTQPQRFVHVHGSELRAAREQIAKSVSYFTMTTHYCRS
jgi:hypothetical protein